MVSDRDVMVLDLSCKFGAFFRKIYVIEISTITLQRARLLIELPHHKKN